MPLIDDLKKASPALAEYSDEDILHAMAETSGRPVKDVAEYVGYKTPKSDVGKELYAGGNTYLAGMGHLVAAGADAVGAEGVKKSAQEYAQKKTERAGALQEMSNAPHSTSEIKFGDSDKGVLNYIASIGAQAAPYLAEQLGFTAADVLSGGALTPVHAVRIGELALKAGVGKKAIEAAVASGVKRETAEAALAHGIGRSVTGAAVSTPSMTGQALDQQYEQAGKYNIPSAMAAGAASSALGQVGLGGAVTRGGIPVVNSIASRTGRAAAGAGIMSVEQGVAGAGQEAANILARGAVDDKVSLGSDESKGKLTEAMIGGAALGAAAGGVHGTFSSHGNFLVGDKKPTQAIPTTDNAIATAINSKDPTPTVAQQPVVAPTPVEPGAKPPETPATDPVIQKQQAAQSANTQTQVSPEAQKKIDEFNHLADQHEQISKAQRLKGDIQAAKENEYQAQRFRKEADKARAMPNVIPDSTKEQRKETPVTPEEHAAIILKYPHQDVKNPDGKTIGYELLGKRYYTEQALTEAMDKLAVSEREKPELQQHAEMELAKSYNSPDKPITPGLLKKYAKTYIEGAGSINDIVERIDVELKALDDKGSKASQAEAGILGGWRDNLLGDKRGTTESQRKPVGEAAKPAKDAESTPIKKPETAEAVAAPKAEGNTEPGPSQEPSGRVGSGSETTETLTKGETNEKPIETGNKQREANAGVQSERQPGPDGHGVPKSDADGHGVPKSDADVRGEGAGQVREAGGSSGRTSGQGEHAESPRISKLSDTERQSLLTDLFDKAFGKRSAEVIRDHVVEGMSQPEIAKKHGLSQQRVSQLVAPFLEGGKANVKDWKERVTAAARRLGLGDNDLQALFKHMETEREAPHEEEHVAAQDTAEDTTPEASKKDELDPEALYGAEGKDTQTMGIVKSAGGSQGKVAEEESVGARWIKAHEKGDTKEMAKLEAEMKAKKPEESSLEKDVTKRARSKWDSVELEGKPKFDDLPEDLQGEWEQNVKDGHTSLSDMNHIFEQYEQGKHTGRYDSKGAELKFTKLLEKEEREREARTEKIISSPEVAAAVSNFTDEGLGHVVGRVRLWTELPSEVVKEGFGGFATTMAGGKYEISIGSAKEIGASHREHVVHHELGHVLDNAGNGDKYSGRPEFSLYKTHEGEVVTTGKIAEEIKRLYDEHGEDSPIADFKNYFSYPLDTKLHGKLSTFSTRREMFAQLSALYMDPKVRPVLKAASPILHSYMEGVIKNEKQTQNRFPRSNSESAKGLSEVSASKGEALETPGEKSGVTPFLEKMKAKVAALSEHLPKKGDTLTFRQEYGFPRSDQKFVVDRVEMPTKEGDQPKVHGTVYDKADNETFEGAEATGKDSYVSSGKSSFYLTNFEETKAIGVKFLHNKAFPSKGGPLETSEKARPAVEKTISRLPEATRRPVQRLWDTLANTAKKATLFSAFTEDVAAMGAKVLPTVKTYIDTMLKKSSTQTHHVKKIDELATRFSSLPVHERGIGERSVNSFLQDSTESNKWGYKPDHVTKRVDIDPALERRFNALSPEGQSLVKDIFKHGDDTLKEKQQGVRNQIMSTYEGLLNAEGVDAEEATKLRADRESRLKLWDSLMDLHSGKPYAPLKRFGQYVSLLASKEYLTAEKNGDHKLMTKLQQDEKHYRVEFHDTFGEAKALTDKEKGGYAYAEPFEKSIDHSQLYGGARTFDAFQQLKEHIADQFGGETSPESKKALASINRMVSDLYLTTLSEASARKSELRRRNIAGASKDMMKAFVTQGHADANFLGSLKHNADILKSISAMRKEAGSREEGRNERNQVLNELLKRHAGNMDYQPTRVQDVIAGIDTIWMLALSPAYHLQNATQTHMMTVPVLAGKHGYGLTNKILGQSFKDLAPMLKQIKLGENAKLDGVPADVKKAIFELVDRGRIDIGMNQDLGSFSSLGDSRLSNAAKTVFTGLKDITQKVETINRVMSGMTAYRLERMSGSSHDASVAYADKVIRDTHGDYSGFNTPRLISPQTIPFAKVITQFRKFQLLQASLFAKLIHNSFKGEDKWVARKALGYMLAHHAALGGVMGLPAAGLLTSAFEKFFGDENEPDDAEVTMRKAIGDKDLADLILKGVPARMGLDVSGKIGAGNMLSLLPFTNVDLTSKSGYEKTLTAALGPFLGGLMPKAADAVGMLQKGDYYKGLEQLMPSGLQNAMKGYRYADQGVTLKNNDVVLKPDEITLMDALSQALGMPSTTITGQQTIQHAQMEYQQFFLDKETALKHSYAKAVRDGDTEKLGDLRDKWGQMQESMKANGFRAAPLGNLLKAPMEQAKRERSVQHGVEVKKGGSSLLAQLGT